MFAEPLFVIWEAMKTLAPTFITSQFSYVSAIEAPQFDCSFLIHRNLTGFQ